jgi:hypothetical protein
MIEGKKNNLLFGKQNYMIMLAGVALILLGFLIMTLDKEQYGFGFMGFTLGPITIMSGFIVEFFAIFHKSK